jgi:hypothetical protein
MVRSCQVAGPVLAQVVDPVTVQAILAAVTGI